MADHIQERVGESLLTPVSISAGRGFVSQSEKFGRDISGKQYRNYIRIRRGDFSYNKGNSKRFPQGCVYALVEFEEAAAPSAFISFRLREGYVNGFFKPQFEKNSHGLQLKRFITSGARSDGLLNISAEEFFSVELPISPTESEQRKIAECLTSLDDLIAAEGRKLEALRTFKKGLLQNLFPRPERTENGVKIPAETNPRLRFTEFQNAGEWEITNLTDTVFFQEGPGIMTVDFRDSGVPLIRLAGLGEQYVTLNGCNYLEHQKVEQKWNHFRLEIDDLVVSCSATLSKPARVTPEAEGAVFYTGLVRFRPKNKHLVSGYLESFLGSDLFTTQAILFAEGGGMKHFGPSHLKRMLMPLPLSTTEQVQIANCLSSLDTLITTQVKKLDTLRTHKQGLMQSLFPSSAQVTDE